MKFWRASLPLLLLVLCSCTVAPPRPVPDADSATLRAEREARVQAIGEWSFNGRVAVRGADVDPRSVRMHWEASGDRHRLGFMSPLGQRLAELEFDADGATLRLPKEEPRSAGSAEALLDEALGWTPPVRGLVYWVRGLAHPDEIPAQDVEDERGRLVLLEQDGWMVEFERWDEAAGVELPRRLTLSHPRLRVRLLVDGWSLGA